MRFNQAINTEAIHDGLDRQLLNTLKKRFLLINEHRLARTRWGLSDRQRIFLEGLSLLFHANHPMLPGYVSHQTPAGISGFKPAKEDVTLGKTLARSFCVSKGPSNQCDIHAVFVMGSVGTIAYSNRSDFDIWVCHRSELKEEARQELQLKCDRIAVWAKERGLDCHFFLMNDEAFKQGQLTTLDTESSGSAQRLLLLDEFYRTGLLLAGRMPLWWFSPPNVEEDYENYTNILIGKRYLREATVIDFGSIATIPDGEFIGAGVWQLYKAIQSPYKSVLKLLLLEAYVSEYPNIKPLSLTYKQMVYDGTVDINTLDPYLTVYRRIEQYLLHHREYQRLELARRCLYFKVNKPLSKPYQGQVKSWQRRVLEELTEAWGWSKETIELLDQRTQWKAPQVMEEYQQLVEQLNHSYRFLNEFVRRNKSVQAISAEEMAILGRKLEAAFDKRPGKIDRINPNISDDIAEPVITLTRAQQNANGSWNWMALRLNSDASKTSADTVIKRSPHLIELIVWCYLNGVINQRTQYELGSEKKLHKNQLQKVFNELDHWLPLPRPSLSHEAFKQTAKAVDVLFLVNLNSEPQPDLYERGMQRLSNQIDALRYGGFEENLVLSIDVVTRNSWDEIHTQSFSGEDALIGALTYYLSLHSPTSRLAPPKLTVECIGQNHTAIINHRLEEWLHEVAACFYSGTKSTHSRFVFEVAGKFHSVQFSKQTPYVHTYKNLSELMHYLGEAQRQYSPIVIDSHALVRHPLKVISRMAKARAISIFYERKKLSTTVYIVDEKGSLVHLETNLGPDQNPIKSLHHFMRSVIDRQVRLAESIDSAFGVHTLEFFELNRDQNQIIKCHPRAIKPEINPKMFFDIKAVVAPDKTGKADYSFYCGKKLLSTHEYGDELYAEVAKTIVSHRRLRAHYPCFISDLDLSAYRNYLSSDGELQLSHYLRVKIELERKLNMALAEL